MTGTHIDEARQTTLLQVLAAVTGQTDFRTQQSEDATVEQNGIMQFWVSLFSISAGALASTDIDITGMTAVMSRSRAGGAFDPAPITQPTFTKGTGKVSCAYQFLLAEWETGDIYRLVLSGVKATVGGDVVFVPDMVWSNEVIEEILLDVAISTRAAPGDQMALTGTEETAVQDLILTDNTPFPGSDIDATISSRASPADINTSLNTEVPATPTAGALTDILSTGSNTFDKSTDSLEAIADAIAAASTDIGTVFSVKKTITQSDVVAAGVDPTGLSTGLLELVSAYVQNGATPFSSAGGTAKLELGSTNTMGPAMPYTDTAEANLIASVTLPLSNGGLGVLESGKKIQAKAISEDFTSAGSADFYLIFRRLTAGATIAAA